jgi:hypothetical protein
MVNGAGVIVADAAVSPIGPQHLARHPLGVFIRSQNACPLSLVFVAQRRHPPGHAPPTNCNPAGTGFALVRNLHRILFELGRGKIGSASDGGGARLGRARLRTAQSYLLAGLAPHAGEAFQRIHVPAPNFGGEVRRVG